MKSMSNYYGLISVSINLILIILLLIYITLVDSLDSAEIFGHHQHYNSKQLYHDNHHHHSQVTSAPYYDQIRPSNYSKQFNDQPVTTEIAVTHPIVGDTNARIPLYAYNPALARKLGLSTLLMTSVLYGLTILPALFTISGGNSIGGNKVNNKMINFLIDRLIAGFFSSLTGKKRRRRRKRDIWPQSPWEMPLMDKDATNKFLKLLENTMEIRKVNSTICKKHHLCRVYQKAINNQDDEPFTLSSLEKAIVSMFG